MCAINPKHKASFTINFYTAFGTEEAFLNNVTDCLLKLEREFNRQGAIRAHIESNTETIPIQVGTIPAN